MTKLAVLRHAALPNVARATLPETYARARTALVKCERLDECKDWADKAAALASYAKQADDDSLQKLALRIQARAIRRCGELLKKFQSPGARTDRPRGSDSPRSTQRRAAASAGMSKDQEKQAVRVANVPEQAFDAAIDGERPPTVAALAEMGTSKQPHTAPPGFADATHAIGRLKELAIFCREHPPELIASAIYDYEVPKVRAHLEVVGPWLAAFAAHLQGGKR
jgi:hypothetical protein